MKLAALDTQKTMFQGKLFASMRQVRRFAGKIRDDGDSVSSGTFRKDLFTQIGILQSNIDFLTNGFIRCDSVFQAIVLKRFFICLGFGHFIETRVSIVLAVCQEGVMHKVIHTACGRVEKALMNRAVRSFLQQSP